MYVQIIVKVIAIIIISYITIALDVNDNTCICFVSLRCEVHPDAPRIATGVLKECSESEIELRM